MPVVKLSKRYLIAEDKYSITLNLPDDLFREEGQLGYYDKIAKIVGIIANLDPLTKLANRRCFCDYLAVNWQRHKQEQQSIALIVMDIDYFKRYNDYYGLSKGDECLIKVAQTINKVTQNPRDLVARYGGEEFVAILPNTDIEAALLVAESIQKAIAELEIPHLHSSVSQYLTLSFGVSSLIPTAQTSLEDLIRQADEALNTAKNEGRNRAMAYRSHLN